MAFAPNPPPDTGPRGIKVRIAAVYAPIVAVALVCWIIILKNAHRPALGAVPEFLPAYRFLDLLALAGLCFFLGLRHAMDVDHIAAIDNVTRKLANDGQRAVGVGFFFSLGHSIAVLAMAAILVAGEIYLKKNLGAYSDRIDMIGSSACALVLYLLAFMNVPVLFDALKIYRSADPGAAGQKALDDTLRRKGFMNRYFNWLYRSIDSSWQMLPVGILFGLGFDTATEMVVLASTTTAASSTVLPLSLAFVCLLLFFAAMMFVDSSDSIAMLFAYRWAFTDFRRKALYNTLMTAVSILIAFGIGTVEWLQVLSTALGWKSGVWDRLNGLDLTQLGVASALGFLVLWAAAMLIYRKARPGGAQEGPQGEPHDSLGAGA